MYCNLNFIMINTIEFRFPARL